MFIGDDKYLGKNIETKSLELFLDNYVFSDFDDAFIDPDTKNLAAIKNQEQSGFSDFKVVQNKFLIFIYKRILRISTTYMIAIELAFKKNFLVVDNLWIFGTRIDLTEKGGDIDLYIETNVTTIDNAFEMKQKSNADLINKIGEQKIDIVLNMLNIPGSMPIYEVAKKEGKKII